MFRWMCLASFALTACNADVPCDDALRPSVVVYVEDADGNDVSDANVRYNIGAGDTGTDCTFADPAWDDRAGYLCGSERDGVLVINASHDVHGTAGATVDVGMDECGVVTEVTTLVLEPNP